MDIQARLRQYLDFKGMRCRDFERLCGISNATQLRETTRRYTWRRIASCCDLNVEWLRTGEGEMIVSRHKDIIPSSENAVERGEYIDKDMPVYTKTEYEALIDRFESIIVEKDRQMAMLLDSHNKLMNRIGNVGMSHGHFCPSVEPVECDPMSGNPDFASCQDLPVVSMKYV